MDIILHKQGILKVSADLPLNGKIQITQKETKTKSQNKQNNKREKIKQKYLLDDITICLLSKAVTP